MRSMMKRALLLKVWIVLFVLIGAQPPTSLADDVTHRQGNGAALTAAWSPDGAMIAVSSEGYLSLYTSTFEQIATFETDNEITFMAWNPNSKQIATASHARLVQLWEIPSGVTNTLYATSAPDNRYTGSVSYSPDGTRLASAHLDNHVRVWDTTTREQVQTLSLDAPAYFVAWHPENDWVAVGSSLVLNDEGDEIVLPSIQIWDLPTKTAVYRRDTTLPEVFTSYTEVMAKSDFVPVEFLQWYAQGASLLIETSDHVFPDERGWEIDADTDYLVPMNVLAECGTSNKTARFAPDGNTFAMGEGFSTGGCSGKGHDVWGVEIGSQDSERGWGPLGWPSVSIGPSPVRDITWHPDNLTFVVLHEDGTLVLVKLDLEAEYAPELDLEMILEP
jgi:WD40 repeat protein